MDNLLLIDGNSLINRAFYALPPLTNNKGEPTQAVYGFTTMLIGMIGKYKPKYIAVAFDLPAPTFRHKMYDGYKATRKKMPDELAAQLPILKRQLRLMNISIVEKEGYEADDIIGTLSRDRSVMTYIITGDRDSLQLIDDTTSVVMTKRGITETVLYDEKQLLADYGLTPKQVIDYKSLAGDSSDNIPGVPGVGDKTATGLIAEYGSLDGVYEHVFEIPGKLGEKLRLGEQSARMSYELATINVNVPLDEKTTDFTFDFPFTRTVKRFFIDNNFKSIIKRDELFAEDAAQTEETGKIDFSRVTIEKLEELTAVLDKAEAFSFAASSDGIAASVDGKTEYFMPLRLTLLDVGFGYNEVIKALSPYFADKNKDKFLFEAKKFKHELAKSGYDLTNYDDVKLLQYLVDMRIDAETPGGLLENAGYDKNYPAAAMFALGKRLLADVEKLGMTELYERAERPLTDVLFAMEERGVKVDVDKLDELGEKFTARAAEIAEVVYRLAGRKFNVNSPRQLATVLFDELKIPYPKKGAKHSTNSDILESLQSEYEIVGHALEYRSLMKLNSTYVEGIRKLLTPDNVIHTDYKQTMTSTGRLSSAEPNLQNIPVREDEGKQLRGLFVARPGYTLVSADYSQIELRLMAHFSGDELMLKLYNEGEDIHTRTAAEIFGVKPSEVTSKMRREAKTVNFGIIYGISEYGLAQNLKCSPYVAKKYMTRYFERFKGIKPYLDGVVENAKKTGYTTTLLGRKRFIPELNSSNFQTRQFGERAAMNMPLQGSAADIIKLAMNAVYDKLKGTNSYLILQIHDELIVEARDDEVEKIEELLRSCMENAVKLRVPLTVDVEHGKSWIDC